MTEYAIMRCNKIKSFGQLSRTLKHNFREQDTPNADPERTAQNEHDGAERSTEAMGKVRERLPEKRRKDAVIAVEYLMTASPEWFERHKDRKDVDKAFFDRSKKWLEEKYGKDNVVLTSIHRDEKTPHMAAWVTPITEDGRLCAKDFIGGPAKLRADQTNYHKALGQLQLSRGVVGSKATHERVQAFYTALQPESHDEHSKRFKQPEISSESVKPRKLGVMKKETPEQVADRLNSRYSKTWSEAGLHHSVRTAMIKTATDNERMANKKAERYKEQAEKMKGLEKQLNTMHKQGITAPNGQAVADYLNEKIQKSKALEAQEKSRNKSRGIER